MLSSWHSEGNSRCELRQDSAPAKNLAVARRMKNTLDTVQISLSSLVLACQKHCQRELWIRIFINTISIRMEYNYWQPKDPAGRVEQHPCAYLSGWWLNKPTFAFIDNSAPVQDLHAQWPCLTCPHPIFFRVLRVFSHPIIAVNQSSVDRKPSIPCLPCLVLEAQITR